MDASVTPAFALDPGIFLVQDSSALSEAVRTSFDLRVPVPF